MQDNFAGDETGGAVCFGESLRPARASGTLANLA